MDRRELRRLSERYVAGQSLVGKTIAHVYEDSFDVLVLAFTDGTWARLIIDRRPSGENLDWSRDLEPYEAQAVGLITQQDLERIRTTEAASRATELESEERAELARLLEQYGHPDGEEGAPPQG